MDVKTVKLFFLQLILQYICYGQNVNVSDVPINTTTGNNQTENAVFISPKSKYVIINSNISYPTPGYGVSYFISTIGGAYSSWSGNIYGPVPSTYADPSVVISRTGRISVGYMGYLCSSCFKVSYTDNYGGNWITSQIAGSNTDKGHLWVDNNLNSPLQGRTYAGWVSTSGYKELLFSYSINDCANWLIPSISISNTLTPQPTNRSLGVNIQTSPQGYIYTCWTALDGADGTVTQNNARICFNKSINGGDNWPGINGIGAEKILDINGGFGIVLSSGKSTQVYTWPSMAVNQQNGYIFIVWTNFGVPGSNVGDADIYMIKSDNEGLSWSNPIRVNQDATTNDQWYPWIACDEISNALVVVYYDSRSDNTRANTYISISYNEGNTWEDFLISDEDWDGDAKYNPGMDYIQVDVYHGHALPVWSDDRASAGTDFRAYTNPFEVPCPANLDLIYGNYDIYDQGDYTDYANQLYDGLYRTDGTINVAGSSSTYKVHAGAEVLMEAGEEIVLNDGFESEGEFQAIPNPTCTSFSEKWSGNTTGENQTGNTSSAAENNPDDNKNKNIELEKKLNPSFAIYPNPSNGNFMFVLSNNKNSQIIITNLLGEVIYQSKIFHQTSTVDLSPNPSGLYFVKIITGNEVFVRKLVLQ